MVNIELIRVEIEREDDGRILPALEQRAAL